MKKISLIILGIFLISFVSAIPICVDLDTPSSPELAVTGGVGNLLLTWIESIDEPSCSGIDYYEIWKNDSYLIQTSELTYTDTDVTYGTYSYIIYAVDKASHQNSSNEAIIILTATSTFTEDSGGSSGGGGGDSSPKDTQTFIPLTTDTSQDNGGIGDIIPTDSSETNFFSRMTGAVIGGVTDFAKTTTGPIALVVLIGSLTLFIVVRKHKLRKYSKSPIIQESVSETEMTN